MRADNLKSCWLVRDNIRAEGCKHLAKANWRPLSILYLGDNIDIKDYNPIGEKGLSYVIKIINLNIGKL